MADASTTSKTCTRCGILKNIDLFFNRSRSKDGKRSECKVCCAKDNKDYAIRNPHVIAECSKNWIKRNPQKRRDIKNSWNQKNSESIRKSNNKQKEKRLKLKEHDRELHPRLFNDDGSRKSPRQLILMAFPEPRKTWKEIYQESREDCLERQRRWRDSNRNELRMRYRKYCSENREKMNAKFQRYRAKKFNAMPSWADIGKINGIYEQARILTALTGIKHHVDHKVPLNSPVVQGFHCEANLQILTEHENISKGNRHWPDMW